MRNMTFAQAIEDSLAYAMEKDNRVIILGEDVHMLRVNLFSRFGKERVRSTPISESAFLGAAVSAAMSGLRPVAEIMMVDFIAVAVDALINHAAKVDGFTNGKWQVPLVVRAACGGGYGDGGQHEQCLWGWLAHIPGLSVVVPSNPGDAGGLMLAAIKENGPVIYCEHKLLADYWRDYLGSGGRDTVSFSVPEQGQTGAVPDTWEAVPLGRAKILRDGSDITIVSVGVGVHRSLEAALVLDNNNIKSTVIDLRSIAPLDAECICKSVAQTKRLLVVDEDYEQFGLSGEIAARVLENQIAVKYGRVCTKTTIPYSRKLEDETLPSTEKIVNTALLLIKD
jgi:acetoin:2,6-dichlorophenolindophenol oxidoreductase subunit beta